MPPKIENRWSKNTRSLLLGAAALTVAAQREQPECTWRVDRGADCGLCIQGTAIYP